MADRLKYQKTAILQTKGKRNETDRSDYPSGKAGTPQGCFLAAKVNGMNIRQVLGCGNQYGWVAHNRGTSVMMNMIPKIEIKIVVADDKVEEIIQLIMSVVRTGNWRWQNLY